MAVMETNFTAPVVLLPFPAKISAEKKPAPMFGAAVAPPTTVEKIAGSVMLFLLASPAAVLFGVLSGWI